MIKPILKKLYYLGLTASFADKRKISQIKGKKKVAILNLHRVSPEENPFWSPLRPEIFEELLRFMKANFEIGLFGELEKLEHSEKPLAVLSFDDGYYDFIEYALPLLEKHGLRANMNVIPECAESGKPIWNVRLYDFLNAAPRKLINEIRLPGFDTGLTDDTAAAKLRYGLKLSRYLKLRPKKEREEIWQKIEPFFSQVEFGLTRMMSTDDIRAIADKTEIGVHSYSHENMGFEDNEFFIEDLERCKAYFANKLHLPMTIYAFPNGSYRQEQVEYLKQHDIDHVLLVDEKFADLHADAYPRLTIYGETKAEVRLKSLGF